MMCCVTKPLSIQFINGKCHVKKQKSCRIGLTEYYACFSHELLLMPSGQTHTHIHQLSGQKQFQENRHVPSLKAHCSTGCSASYVCMKLVAGYQ